MEIPLQHIKPRTLTKLDPRTKEAIHNLLAWTSSRTTLLINSLFHGETAPEYGITDPAVMLDTDSLLRDLPRDISIQLGSVFRTIIFNKTLRFVSADEIDDHVKAFQASGGICNAITFSTMNAIYHGARFKSARERYGVTVDPESNGNPTSFAWDAMNDFSFRVKEAQDAWLWRELAFMLASGKLAPKWKRKRR